MCRKFFKVYLKIIKKFYNKKTAIEKAEVQK